MATITHISHFGLVELGRDVDRIVFEGSLGACRRMAFAHGMEVEEVKGRFVSTDDGKGMHLPATEGDPAWTFFKGGGLIHKGRDKHCLVMPMSVWVND